MRAQKTFDGDLRGLARHLATAAREGSGIDQVEPAMRALFVQLELIVEPSGACALAAVLAARAEVSGRRVGVILSGGNVDQHRFDELIAGRA